MSDLAFHTLREYVPGDDRRHVHWRSTARLGRLMVRQFLDTRRSELALILSTSPGDYTSEDEFELAVSVVGSLGRNAASEDQGLTCVVDGRAVPAHSGPRLLDSLAGVELARSNQALAETVRRSIPAVRGSSVVALVAGSGNSVAQLRSGASRLPADARILVFRCALGSTASLKDSSSMILANLGSLEDLARVMRSVADR